MSMGSERRQRVQQNNDEPSRTKQSMKDECDVNRIVERYRTTGLLEHVAQGQPRYLNVSDVGDFRTAVEHVQSVNEFFMKLPADMRADFNNDPAEYIDWITDPNNAQEVAEYGLHPAEESGPGGTVATGTARDSVGEEGGEEEGEED